MQTVHILSFTTLWLIILGKMLYKTTVYHIKK